MYVAISAMAIVLDGRVPRRRSRCSDRERVGAKWNTEQKSCSKLSLQRAKFEMLILLFIHLFIYVFVLATHGPNPDY